MRTENGKGRKLSTVRAIELLAFTTVNRWLRTWNYYHARMTRPPPAVRFEARHSNALWHFGMSPYNLKHIRQPEWIDIGKATPTLTLFSIVDDRSGAAYYCFVKEAD